MRLRAGMRLATVTVLAFLGAAIGVRCALRSLEVPAAVAYSAIVGGALAGWLAALVLCQVTRLFPVRTPRGPRRWRVALAVVLACVAAATLEWNGRWATSRGVATEVLVGTLAITEDQDEFRTLAQALADVNRGSARSLVAILQDDRVPRNARLGAAEALGFLGRGAEPVVPALIAMLEEGDRTGERAQLACNALGYIGPPAASAAPALTATLRATREDAPVTHRCAIWAIGLLGPAAACAVPELILTLQDREVDSETRRLAAMALGHIGPDAAPGLLVLLRRCAPSDVWPQVYALNALQDMGPVAIPVLLTLLREPSSSDTLRVLSARTLAESDDLAFPVLAATLLDPEAEVGARRAAASGLVRLRPRAEPIAVVLATTLRDESAPEMLRLAAAHSLGSVCQKDDVWTAFLEDTAEHDDDRILRFIAGRVLRAIHDNR